MGPLPQTRRGGSLEKLCPRTDGRRLQGSRRLVCRGEASRHRVALPGRALTLARQRNGSLPPLATTEVESKAQLQLQRDAGRLHRGGGAERRAQGAGRAGAPLPRRRAACRRRGRSFTTRLSGERHAVFIQLHRGARRKRRGRGSRVGAWHRVRARAGGGGRQGGRVNVRSGHLPEGGAHFESGQGHLARALRPARPRGRAEAARGDHGGRSCERRAPATNFVNRRPGGRGCRGARRQLVGRRRRRQRMVAPVIGGPSLWIVSGEAYKWMSSF
mmetsp:Transcript_28946/g.66464  ORF Transcript_28946/g.66464 Transcript_28946/m.66464 type:complete len:273 (-) Transcript_28946:30-848(-)